LLQNAQSRKIIGRVEIDSASLFVHRDSSSLLTSWTDNLSRWSVRFGFDRELFVTRVYEKVIRKSLRDTFTRPKIFKHHSDNASIGASITTSQPDGFEGKKRSQMIDRDLRKGQSLSRSPITSLVLGDSTSGKEQILNQMKCTSQGGYTLTERLMYQQCIYGTVFECIKYLLKTMKRMDIAPGSEVNRGHYVFLLDHVLNRDPTQPLRSNLGDAVHSIWNDPCIKELQDQIFDFHSMDRMS
jgi:hypothetical protein